MKKSKCSSKGLVEEKWELQNFPKFQREKNLWYVDSGLPTHMTDEKNKFIPPKEWKATIISFGNDGSANVIGKGTIKPRGKYDKTKYLHVIENMNHSLFNISQMFDYSHTERFDSKKFERRREKYGKLVATATKALNEMYILDDTINKGCFIWK